MTELELNQVISQCIKRTGSGDLYTSQQAPLILKLVGEIERLQKSNEMLKTAYDLLKKSGE